MLLHMTLFHSFLWLSNGSLHVYTPHLPHLRNSLRMFSSSPLLHEAIGYWHRLCARSIKRDIFLSRNSSKKFVFSFWGDFGILVKL